MRGFGIDVCRCVNGSQYDWKVLFDLIRGTTIMLRHRKKRYERLHKCWRALADEVTCDDNERLLFVVKHIAEVNITNGSGERQ